MADASLSLDEIIKKKKIKPFKNQNNNTSKTTKGAKGAVKRLGKNLPQKSVTTKKNIVTTKNKMVTDARNKIIQKKKLQIGDARDKLGQLARQGDARERLNKLKKVKQGVAATRIGGKAGPTNLTTKKAALVKKQLGLQTRKNITAQGKNLNRTVATVSRNVSRNQDYQQRPQNMRMQPQPVQYQPRGMRPDMMYDSYPQEQVQYVSYASHGMEPDMMYEPRYPQEQVIYRQPQQQVIYRQPQPVYRPAPVYVDEYDGHINHRETVYVDQRGEPIRNRPVYADAPMRRPAPVHVQKQHPMSGRLTQQPRPQQQQRQQQQARPQQNQRPQQQARPKPQAQPQQQGQKVMVNNLHSSVSGEDMKEIFGTIGKVVSCRMVRQGIAEAIFLKRQDAVKFVEAFDNRLLDGQPMNATLVNSKSNVQKGPNPKSVLKGAKGYVRY